ncbi:MAG: hypothetical protein ABIK09_04575 [Pseudomonadota bacterium]
MSGWFSIIVALVFATGHGARAEDPVVKPALELSGVVHVPEEQVRKAAGRPPGRVKDRATWARGAVRRIVKLYRKNGYTQARGWSLIKADEPVRIHVDEGVMSRVVFVGTGAVRGMIYRVDLNLPGDVFNRPVLDRALADLKERYCLSSVRYRVVETEYLIAAPLGHLAPLREIRIYVASPDRFGWGVDLRLEPIWGPVVRGRFSYGSLLLDGDSLSTALVVAAPYRSFIFSAAPRFTWVHGAADLRYRLPPFVSGHLAVQLESETSVSQFSRPSIGIDRAFVLRTRAIAGLAVMVRPLLDASLGSGVDYAHIFGLARVTTDVPDPAPQDLANNRGLLRVPLALSVALHFSPEVLREDLRDELQLEVCNSFTSAGTWLGTVDAHGQGVWRFGPHVLLLRGRGIFRAGDVHFFDEASLGGSYLRAFFDSRYWVREAAELELAFRGAVWKDAIYLGLFNDVAVFGDRSKVGNHLAAAEVFGPSLHFLVFDRFAWDFYYGFGFAPVGFSHNFSFEMRTVF